MLHNILKDCLFGVVNHKSASFFRKTNTHLPRFLVSLKVIAGTNINTGYTVADDGTIQLAPMNHYQDARVPLLADVAHR